VQIAVGQLRRDRIGDRIGRVEQTEDLLFLRRDLGVGHGPFEPQQVVGFGLHDVAAKRAGQRRLVGLHVQHVLDGVPEMPDARALQVVQHLGDLAPLADLGPGRRVVVEHAQDHRRRLAAHADRHAGELGHRAEIVVAQLHVGRRAGVVQRRQRLERDQHDRNVQAPRNGRKRGRRGVGQHVAEHQIEVGRLEPWQQRISRLGVVDHAEIHHLDLLGLDHADEPVELAHQLVQQSVELRPVGVEADAEHADARGQRFAARDAGNVHAGSTPEVCPSNAHCSGDSVSKAARFMLFPRKS
jgi:hypothetical protein